MNRYLLILMVAVLLGACKKTTDNLPTAQLNEYMPLHVGKYIEYQLDSLRFIHFGQRDTVISYRAKDVVEADLTATTGQPSFRVVRYLRNLNSTNEADYRPTLTYIVDMSRESVELLEDNLRYQKLRLPINDGFNWHGNAYLPSSPFFERYEFSNDEDMDMWDYTYENVYEPAELNGTVYDSTITILQVADSSNVPIEFPDGLAYKNYWIEQYAKNIGLVYKEVEMWEYQPPAGGNPGYRSGFGLRMTILDHN